MLKCINFLLFTYGEYKMGHSVTSPKNPMQRTIELTIFISVLYIIFKYFDQSSPKGNAFLSYIIPTLFSDVVLIVFPLLFVFFYFKDGNVIKDIKNSMSNEPDCNMDDRDAREILRDYHAMMKEGIITQEEFDLIKKKYIKKLNQIN